MISKENIELLGRMKETAYGEALKEWIEDQILELSNLDTVESWDDTLGRKQAKKILNKLSKTVTPVDKSKTNNSQYE